MPERLTERLAIRLKPSQRQRIREVATAYDIDEAEMVRDIIMSGVERAARRLDHEQGDEHD